MEAQNWTDPGSEAWEIKYLFFLTCAQDWFYNGGYAPDNDEIGLEISQETASKIFNKYLDKMINLALGGI